MKLAGVLGTLGMWVAISIPVLIIYREEGHMPTVTQRFHC